MGDRGYSPALMALFEVKALRVIRLCRKFVPIRIGLSLTDLKNVLES